MSDLATLAPAIERLIQATNTLNRQLAEFVKGAPAPGPMSVHQAAKYLGMCPAKLRGLVEARIIPCERIGSGIRAPMKFRLRDLDAYREKQRKRFA